MYGEVVGCILDALLGKCVQKYLMEFYCFILTWKLSKMSYCWLIVTFRGNSIEIRGEILPFSSIRVELKRIICHNYFYTKYWENFSQRHISRWILIWISLREIYQESGSKETNFCNFFYLLGLMAPEFTRIDRRPCKLFDWNVESWKFGI